MGKGRYAYRATGKLAKTENERETHRYDEHGKVVGHSSGLETVEFDDDGNETSRQYKQYETDTIDRP